MFLGNTKEREENVMKCPKCGQKLRQSKKNPDKMLCDNCRKSYWIDDLEDEYSTPAAPLKTWKLVSGILSIILFVFVTFQSSAQKAVFPRIYAVFKQVSETNLKHYYIMISFEICQMLSY